jgi:spermidine synthase
LIESVILSDAGLDHSRARVLHRAAGLFGTIEVHDDGAMRWLQFDDGIVQSAMALEHPEVLVLPYTRAMMAALLFCSSPARVLTLGLGGGSLPRFLARHCPGARQIAVEKDPAVIDAARRYFQMDRYAERLEIRAADARAAVCEIGDPCELLLVDLFEAGGQPAQFPDLGFYGECRRLLAPGGLMAVNLWVGDSAEFLTWSRLLRQAFDGRTLFLPVGGYSNVVQLAFRDPPEELGLECLRTRAEPLAARLGIELGHFLEKICANNLTLNGDLVL